MNRPGSIVGSIIVDPRSLIADRLWLRYADFHIVGDPELQTLSIPSNLSDVMERVQDAMQVPVLALHYDDRNLRRLYEIRSQEDFTRCLVAFEEFFSRELKVCCTAATRRAAVSPPPVMHGSADTRGAGDNRGSSGGTGKRRPDAGGSAGAVGALLRA